VSAPAIVAAASAARRGDGDEPSPSRALIGVVILALWLGAATLFTATVAPAAFAVLPSRMLAGALVGRVLPIVFVAGIASGVLALVLAARSGAPRRTPHRVGAALLILGCAIAQFGVGPRIIAMRAELPADLESIPTTDARRVEFGKLHGISVALLGVAMIGGAMALVAGAWPRPKDRS
jgi:hypothetical protein